MSDVTNTADDPRRPVWQQRSADARLMKGREEILACRTPRQLLEVVMRLMSQEYQRGYAAGVRSRRRP